MKFPAHTARMSLMASAALALVFGAGFASAQTADPAPADPAAATAPADDATIENNADLNQVTGPKAGPET
jgi:nitrite reductase (NO-forming)/hydroxylamine reductase